jgi:hypothetical protein
MESGYDPPRLARPADAAHDERVDATREHIWEGPALVAGIVTGVIWLSASLFGAGPGGSAGPEPPLPRRDRLPTSTPEPTWPPPTAIPGARVVVPWRQLEARYTTIPVEPGGEKSHPLARFAVVEGSIAPGPGGAFVVTLTAHDRDVPLDPCPDFNVSAHRDDVDRYGLDCAGVPYRDEQGAPYLPRGRPIEFVIDVGAERGWWELAAPGGVRLALPGAS